MNERTTEDIVRLMQIDGEDVLFFKAFPINVALIRGTTADPDGNITTERESLALENLALAIAARNSGGIVIAQVERVAAEGTLDARNVKVPGILVDCVVLTEPEHHMQTYGTQFNPALSGELRLPPARVRPVELSDRKVIARRAVLELAPNSVINVGVGSIPDQVPLVASEERVQDLLSLAVDSGVIGGVPMSGLDFGTAINYQAVIDHACAFDFIDGGGLDAAFLGFGECDALGNVNASKFGQRIPGCGGFIDISQNAKKVVFMGTFSSGGLEVVIDEGRIRIANEGRIPKFVERIGQITFSADYARRSGQEVLFVTERCVFRLEERGLAVIEVAPGIDLERDVLQRLPFRPLIDGPREMDPAVFRNAPMRLRERMLDLRMEDRLSYDEQTNTVYMNYAGLRVRRQRRSSSHRRRGRQAARSARKAGALHRELRALHLRRRRVRRVRRAGETSRADVLPQREALYERRIPASQAGDRARQAGDLVRNPRSKRAQKAVGGGSRGRPASAARSSAPAPPSTARASRA